MVGGLFGDNNDERKDTSDHGYYQQQAAHILSSILLMAIGDCEFVCSLACILGNVEDVAIDAFYKKIGSVIPSFLPSFT